MPSSSSGRERWTPASATSCSQGSLAIALAVAWGPTFVEQALIRRGKGHALAHAHHQAH